MNKRNDEIIYALQVINCTINKLVSKYTVAFHCFSLHKMFICRLWFCFIRFMIVCINEASGFGAIACLNSIFVEITIRTTFNSTKIGMISFPYRWDKTPINCWKLRPIPLSAAATAVADIAHNNIISTIHSVFFFLSCCCCTNVNSKLRYTHGQSLKISWKMSVLVLFIKF